MGLTFAPNRSLNINKYKEELANVAGLKPGDITIDSIGYEVEVTYSFSVYVSLDIVRQAIAGAHGVSVDKVAVTIDGLRRHLANSGEVHVKVRIQAADEQAAGRLIAKAINTDAVSEHLAKHGVTAKATVKEVPKTIVLIKTTLSSNSTLPMETLKSAALEQMVTDLGAIASVSDVAKQVPTTSASASTALATTTKTSPTTLAAASTTPVRGEHAPENEQSGEASTGLFATSQMNPTPTMPAATSTSTTSTAATKARFVASSSELVSPSSVSNASMIALGGVGLMCCALCVLPLFGLLCYRSLYKREKVKLNRQARQLVLENIDQVSSEMENPGSRNDVSRSPSVTMSMPCLRPAEAVDAATTVATHADISSNLCHPESSEDRPESSEDSDDLEDMEFKRQILMEHNSRGMASPIMWRVPSSLQHKQGCNERLSPDVRAPGSVHQTAASTRDVPHSPHRIPVLLSLRTELPHLKLPPPASVSPGDVFPSSDTTAKPIKQERVVDEVTSAQDTAFSSELEEISPSSARMHTMSPKTPLYAAPRRIMPAVPLAMPQDAQDLHMVHANIFGPGASKEEACCVQREILADPRLARTSDHS